MGLTELAFQNLLSPMVLFFVVGLAAALAKSDLTVPEAVAKLLSLYLLMSIGFRGGVEVAHHGMSWDLVAAICAGVLLSYFTPILAYLLLTRMSRLSPVDAAAVAGHYGSISAVTFAAVTGALNLVSLPFAGYMVAVAAAMETPAIVSALQLARSHRKTETGDGHSMWREVMLNGSVVTLLGAFVVGMITGPKGLATVKPFLVDLFPGFLCVFLLDMGLIAGRGLQHGRKYLSVPLCSFAVLMPLIGAALGALLASAIGLSAGSAAVLMTLAASASYIAVPAALRLALPEANAAIPLTLSLGITFPFNLLVGIPLYIGAATMLAGAVK
ncbi:MULTISPECIES: sodium-dependent bicarbonate transport family permease [unclassified Bradyrhizobium]|uniref:sodium-dependent bicarbonate transport family permease n=1 Tax=unclassified Bradyrhizobium TaxID=2631580 RepID=UPI0028EB572F|nr:MULTISPECIES: sodium-dependent bicarbonate transport family permease [unclassified Bradyrhizobium]